MAMSTIRNSIDLEHMSVETVSLIFSYRYVIKGYRVNHR